MHVIASCRSMTAIVDNYAELHIVFLWEITYIIDYDSYLSNQWVSLIPLKFGKRHDGPCVDP